MDHMEFSIALPPLVELTNAGVEWNTMKQRLYTHLNPNANANSNNIMHRNYGSRRPFLISIASEQVQGIFNMYDVSYDEAAKFSKILQSIEDLCLPRFLIIYNRFRFFTCKQNGPEFNGFLQQLLAWSDLCEFGDLKDILLKDCIISGISEESVRQHLLRTEQLDFDKTVDICRAGLAKQDSVDDLENLTKVFVDAATSTDDQGEEEYRNVDNHPTVEKFNVAVNTCLEVKEEATQTHVPDFVEILENSDLISHLHVLKHLAVDGNLATDDNEATDDNGDQETQEISKNELYVLQESISRQGTIVSEYDKHQSTDGPDCKREDLKFDINHQETETPVLRRSLRNRRPAVINSQEVFVPEFADGLSDNTFRTASPDKYLEASISLNRHSLLNDESPNFGDAGANLKCRACKMSFRDLQSLHKHKKTHEGDKKYKCDVCTAKFFNASHLKVHKRLHTGERPFVCDTCGESYVEASKLKAHIRKHTGERPYKCTVCQMTFTWSAAFSRHKRTHTGEKPYACQCCSATFADFTALQRHTRTHTKEKPYKCEICSFSFGDSSALKSHKRVHTGERPYNCKYCSSSFTREQHVREHMKLHRGEKPYKCDTCGATFVEASKLKSHLRRHTGERPYQCKVCGASFAWTAAFTRHMRTHTFEKPYSCKVCGCAFADHSTLIRHHRTHTGEKPYHCNVCGSCFADSSSLNRHQKIHTGEKAFTCEICGTSFAVKSYLNRHIRIHTGEKPYGCDKCDAKFSDSSKLRRHQKIHDRAKLKEEAQQSMITPTAPPLYPTLNVRHEIPHFHDDELLSHLAKPCAFDHTVKPDHQFDPMHGHDNEVTNVLALSFTHPHDDGLDLATSVSASLGMAPGMESLANILSFDS